MVARMFACAIALVTGFLFGAAALRLTISLYQRRKATLAAQGEEISPTAFARWRVRNGFDAFKPVARVLLTIKVVSETVDEAVYALDLRGVTATRESLTTAFLAVEIFLSCVVGLAAASPVAAIVTPLGACAIAVFAVGNARDKRQEAARDSVPAALESMAACFGSGFTLQQTFQQVSHDVDGPLASTFSRASHILEMGGGADRALDELKRGSCAEELAFIAVALDVQHQSGGAMRQVLQAATETAKGELALKRSLRVQTSQARLSARVVAVMPFVLVCAFSLASPDFLMPFFESVKGYVLLALAVAMLVIGVMLVRRALAVEGVS